MIEDSSLVLGSSTVCKHATSIMTMEDVACSHTVELPGTKILSSIIAPIPCLAHIEVLT